MKRIKSILLALTFAMTVTAQNSSSHLTFKGVPIDGTLTEFADKLVKKGFSYPNTLPKEYEDKIRNAGWGGLLDLAKLADEESNSNAHLKGTFAGYSSCDIFINTLWSADIVNSVVVEFPYRADWVDLIANYTNLKEMLTEKYGAPQQCEEHIPGTKERYFDRANAFEEGTGAWFAQYDLSNGKIILYLKTSHIELHYIDAKNTSLQRSKAIDDL